MVNMELVVTVLLQQTPQHQMLIISRGTQKSNLTMEFTSQSLTLVNMLPHVVKRALWMCLSEEMERLCWIIWVAQCNFKGNHKWKRKPRDWQSMKGIYGESWMRPMHCERGSMAIAGFKDWRGNKPRNVGGLWKLEETRKWILCRDRTLNFHHLFYHFSSILNW